MSLRRCPSCNNLVERESETCPICGRSFAQAIVAHKVADHRFAIKTDKPNVEVSWQVTGIRQDAWANAHRIPVEEQKAEVERGTYLHPELFGAPEEKGVLWGRAPQAMKQWKETRTKLSASAQKEPSPKP